MSSHFGIQGTRGSKRKVIGGTFINRNVLFLGNKIADKIDFKNINQSKPTHALPQHEVDRRTPFQFSQGPKVNKEAQAYAKAWFDEKDKREYNERRYENLGYAPSSILGERSWNVQEKINEKRKPNQPLLGSEVLQVEKLAIDPLTAEKGKAKEVPSTPVKSPPPYGEGLMNPKTGRKGVVNPLTGNIVSPSYLEKKEKRQKQFQEDKKKNEEVLKRASKK